MSFLHPQLLWLLLVPGVLLVAAFVPRARAAAIAHPKITRARLRSALGHWSLVIGHSVRGPRPLAAIFALACLVVALARPQGRTISTPTVTEARDVLVAVDVSRSMLADDVAPNRLARAQLLIRDLADELAGERLGLLPFAGTAFLQSPLSADYEIFRTFLDELGPDMIPAGGSNFTALLNTADEAFGPADSTAPDAPQPADRYLVVLSDGEAQDESWKPVAQKLAARGVRVLSLGLGTASGAMVPDGKGGLVKDERGAAVLSRLDASTLRELSRLTEGAYRDASAWVDLPALLKETVARGRGSRDTTDTAPRREELFAWFLGPALALLLASLVREFPVFPRPRATRAAPPPLPRGSAAVFAFLLCAYSALVLAPNSFAADAPATPPPDPLVDLVGRLAGAEILSGSDLARLATLTADQGEKARAEQKDLIEGALRDALAAVNQGQTADPRAADWPALRKRLDALLAPPPKPPEKPDQPKNENQKSDDQQKDPKDSEDQKSSESENPDKKDGPQSKDSQGKQPSDSADTTDKSGESDPSQSSSGDDATKPPGSSSQALGDLAQKPDDPKSSDASPPTASPPDAETPPPPGETQQAGGVSASGQPEGASTENATTQMDPALAVPQQRLERVRDSDAPARLYQLMQDAELPPDSPARAAGKKQDW